MNLIFFHNISLTPSLHLKHVHKTKNKTKRHIFTDSALRSVIESQCVSVCPKGGISISFSISISKSLSIKYLILDTRISVFRPFVMLRGFPLDSETEWTGELSSP